MNLNRRQMLMCGAAMAGSSLLRLPAAAPFVRVAVPESVLLAANMGLGRSTGRVLYTENCLRAAVPLCDNLLVLDGFRLLADRDGFGLDDVPPESVIGRTLKPEFRNGAIWAEVALVRTWPEPGELRWAAVYGNVRQVGNDLHIESVETVACFAPKDFGAAGE